MKSAWNEREFVADFMENEYLQGMAVLTWPQYYATMRKAFVDYMKENPGPYELSPAFVLKLQEKHFRYGVAEKETDEIMEYIEPDSLVVEDELLAKKLSINGIFIDLKIAAMRYFGRYYPLEDYLIESKKTPKKIPKPDNYKRATSKLIHEFCPYQIKTGTMRYDNLAEKIAEIDDITDYIYFSGGQKKGEYGIYLSNKRLSVVVKLGIVG